MPYESKSIEDMTFHGGCTGVIVDGPYVIMYIKNALSTDDDCYHYAGALHKTWLPALVYQLTKVINKTYDDKMFEQMRKNV